jgi:hypothetical protein
MDVLKIKCVNNIFLFGSLPIFVEMKFFDVVLISLMVGFSIIGIHQSIVAGFGNSYWIFMFTLVLLLWYKLRNNTVEDKSNTSRIPPDNKFSRKKVKGK